MKRAVFPGSFDPITLGHYDVIERSKALFDQIIVAIGINKDKEYMFSLDQRQQFIKTAFRGKAYINVVGYDGLTTDFCKQNKAQYILRGLRNSTDFEFEKAIAHTNKALLDIETVFLLAGAKTAHISSSIVRDVIRYRGDYTKFVPQNVRF